MGKVQKVECGGADCSGGRGCFCVGEKGSMVRGLDYCFRCPLGEILVLVVVDFQWRKSGQKEFWDDEGIFEPMFWFFTVPGNKYHSG